MNSPSLIEAKVAAASTVAATLFGRAAAAGRDSLNQEELGTLLASLGMVFTPNRSRQSYA